MRPNLARALAMALAALVLGALGVACDGGDGGGEGTPPATATPTSMATAAPAEPTAAAPTVTAPTPHPDAPDGEILLRCGDGGICSVRADGTDLRQLTTDQVISWARSPDGSRIAYQASLPLGLAYALYVMAADGSDRQMLTQYRSVEYPIAPAWSPDGSMVAIESSKPGDGIAPTEIWLVDVESGEASVFAEADGFASNDGPTWSPDGERIAFASDRDGNAEIWTANLDGSGLENVTRHGASEMAPAWLADGRIAFFTDRDGDWELYVMQADGSDATNLSNDPAWDAMAPVGHLPPAVSPDGRRIAFTSERDGNAEVYVVDVSSGDLIRVTDDPGGDYANAWLPDGEHVVFVSTRRQDVSVWVAAVDGSYVGPVVPAPEGGR